MKEIKCPKCGEVITVDDNTFAAILEQVRNSEFSKEISRRKAEIEDQFKIKEEAVRSSAERDFEKRLSKKDADIAEMKNELTRLQGLIDGFEASKKSELSQLEVASAKQLAMSMGEKDKKIAELEALIASNDENRKVAVLEERNARVSELQEKEKEIIELKSKIESDKQLAVNKEAQLRELHRTQLNEKDVEIERLRDYRQRLSTKMVGESLEQHCAIKFEEAQSLGMYPDAVFFKDNAVVEGTKGDFIFRDYVNGEEYVSIMFEMKNEMDTTATKHRNDDFLDKLDKDRQRKGCEYAVLVSMLEQDNELYNNGIVDKSHRYPKMIVIRPQFFLPVLRLISESSKKGFLDRHALMTELEEARSQTVDFTNFENKINKFRDDFNKNVAAAHKKFEDAQSGIDKVIESLENQIKSLRKVKENFEASEKKLVNTKDLVNEKLTAKSLTHGIPNFRKKIEEAAKLNSPES